MTGLADSNPDKRPEGPMPRASETCPVCGSPPNVPHEPTCPWLLWANNPKREAA